jgi:thiamine transport system ATP-binding protein
MLGWQRERIDARVREILALVGLDGLERRHVDELSGGQRQRVALARSLAPGPRLLMLDEPLGSIDRVLRDQLLQDLPDVFARAGTAVLYVTHDHDEARALGDRVAVMNAGQIEQIDTVDALWSHPTTEFVAQFLGV